MPEVTPYALALHFIPGASDALIKRALEIKISNEEKLAEFLRGVLLSGAKKELAQALASAQRELEAASKLDAEIVALGDRRYPTPLATIDDAPPLLWVSGKLPVGPCVAIAGSREPSDAGIKRARELVGGLASNKQITIVSGLARGIDTAAHERALEVGLPTIAVLGSGLGKVSPKENQRLAERIVEQGGALISEQLMAAPGRAANLVARDRIQSGLCAATVVVQTDLKGGSMHTAAFCLRQGRRLFAFGREPMDKPELWSGNAFLLEKESSGNDDRFAKVKRFGKPLAQRVEPGSAARVVAEALRPAN